MSSRLLVRPVPIPGESPASVLIRAVDGNGYPSLAALVWAYRKESEYWVTASHVDPARYKDILGAFGISIPDIDSLCFRRTGPTSESPRVMDGMEIPEAMFREDARYYCPICLLERSFWRRSWTLRPYSVCVEHHVYLLRDCPACAGELTVSRRKIAKCECGASLSDGGSDHADPAAVNWWLEVHRESPQAARAADMLFQALSEAGGGADDPKLEHRRLCAVQQWMERGTVAAWISEWVDEEAASSHPRILLLPFLRRSKHPEVRALTTAILKLWQVKKPTLEVRHDGAMARGEAELALGVSRCRFQKFLKQGLVDFPDGRKARDGQVSVAAINRILFSSHADGEVAESVGRPQTSSIASMVAAVLSGERESAGYDVGEGLNTLRLVAEQRAKPVETDEERRWLDTRQVADVLGTYSEAVRFLRIKGWIEFRDRDFQRRFRYIARREDVDRFNECYVLGGTIASQLSVNPTNLAERLMAVGVRPVAGPRIDGSLVYLFRRSDLEAVDWDVVTRLRNYPTKTGRKRKSSDSGGSRAKETEIPLSGVARELGVSVQQIRSLIRKGVLERIRKLDRSIFVSRKSLATLRRKLNRKDLVSIDEAAGHFNLSSRSFESLWINTGVLTVVDLGLWRLIRARELEKLKKLLAGHVTAAEAGRMLSMHRSHLPNLERRGVIESKLIGRPGVRLYTRADLERVKRMRWR